MEDLNLKDVKVGDAVIKSDGVNYRCYYVVEVNEKKKEIVVHPYSICADQDKEGGMGHQNWKFFKTVKEENEYLKKYGKGTDEKIYEDNDQVWKIRYNHWYSKYKSIFTGEEKWGRVLDDCLQHCGGIHFNKEPYYYYDWEF